MKICRRSFMKMLAKGSAVIAVAPVFSSIVTACKKSDSKDQHNDIAASETALGCPDQPLSEQEKSIRKSLNYVDQSPMPGRTCDNCKVYTLAQNNNPCGGCKIVPGPIHPKGYCTAWIPRM